MLASTPWAFFSASISAGDIMPSIPDMPPIPGMPGIIEPLGIIDPLGIMEPLGIGMVVVVGEPLSVPFMPPWSIPGIPLMPPWSMPGIPLMPPMPHWLIQPCIFSISGP